MVREKYGVRLTPEQRNHLEHLVRAGKSTARVTTRARILLKTDAAWSAPQVALDVAENGDMGYYPYTLTLHEIGHALGISGFDYEALEQEKDQPGEISHPTIPSSVMNYDQKKRDTWFVWGHQIDSERDCSPYPFDIMALYSLFQKVP